MAPPWAAAPQRSHAQLDRLTALMSVPSDDDVGPEVPRRWFDLAEATEDIESGADLIEQLIAALKERRQ